MFQWSFIALEAGKDYSITFTKNRLGDNASASDDIIVNKKSLPEKLLTVENLQLKDNIMAIKYKYSTKSV